MCDFDDFGDDYDYDFDDEFSDDFSGSIEDESVESSQGFWDLDTADFAIIGGAIGYLEEEIEEKKRLEREMKKEQERIDEEMTDCDVYHPPDDEEFLP